MCLGGGHSSQAQPQAPGPTAGANGPTCQRPHWVGPARDLGGEAPLSLLAALFGAGSSTATDGSIAGPGCPLTPPPRRWLAPEAPPRRRSAAEAAKCNRSADGRTDGRRYAAGGCCRRPARWAEQRPRTEGRGASELPGYGGGDGRCLVVRMQPQAASSGLAQVG